MDPLGLWPDISGITDSLKNNWAKLGALAAKAGTRAKHIGDAGLCYVQFVNCVQPAIENSLEIGRAQGGGPPVYTPDDLEHPSASEGARQCKMAGAGNQNCRDALNNCVKNAMSFGMFPRF